MSWQVTTLVCVIVVALLIDHAVANICKSLIVRRATEREDTQAREGAGS